MFIYARWKPATLCGWQVLFLLSELQAAFECHEFRANAARETTRKVMINFLLELGLLCGRKPKGSTPVPEP